MRHQLGTDGRLQFRGTRCPQRFRMRRHRAGDEEVLELGLGTATTYDRDTFDLRQRR